MGQVRQVLVLLLDRNPGLSPAARMHVTRTIAHVTPWAQAQHVALVRSIADDIA